MAWYRPAVRWIAFPSLRSTRPMPPACCPWRPDTTNRMPTRARCCRTALISGERATFRFGVPRAEQLQFFGNQQAAALFQRSCDALRAIGGTAVEIDFAPFLEAARLLYEGPWVAERYAAIREFFDAQSDAINPVVREIIAGAQEILRRRHFQRHVPAGSAAQGKRHRCGTRSIAW